MGKKIEGQTSDVVNKFLGSEFWEPGASITGVVRRKFQSANGQYYAIELDQPVHINGESTSEVALGNLIGLHMAIQDAGAEDLDVSDRINLECTELQPTNKGNPRIDFKIQIWKE